MRRLLAGEVYQAPLGRYVRVVNDVEAADLRAGRAFEVVEVCASTLRDLPNRRGFFIDREYLSESPVGMAGRVSPGGRGVEEGLDLQDAQEGPFPALGDPISGGLVPPQLEPIQNDSGASNRVDPSDGLQDLLDEILTQDMSSDLVGSPLPWRSSPPLGPSLTAHASLAVLPAAQTPRVRFTEPPALIPTGRAVNPPELSPQHLPAEARLAPPPLVPLVPLMPLVPPLTPIRGTAVPPLRRLDEVRQGEQGGQDGTQGEVGLRNAQEGPFPALGDPISGGLVPPQLEPIQNDSGASNRVETSDRPAESEESEESGGWDLSIGAIEVLPAGSIDVGDWVVTTNPWAVGADTRLPWALAGRVVAVGPVYHQVLIGTGGGGTFRPEDLRAIRLDASRVPQRAALVVVGNCGSVSARLAGLVQVPDWDETSQEWLRMTGRGVRYAAALLEQARVGRASSLVGFEAGLLGLNTPGLARDIWRSLLACCPEAEPESLADLDIEAETESVLGSLTDGIIDAAVARGSLRLRNGEETPYEDVAWLALLEPGADLDLYWLAEAFFTVAGRDDGLVREDDGLVLEDDDLVEEDDDR